MINRSKQHKMSALVKGINRSGQRKTPVAVNAFTAALPASVVRCLYK
jgi:hypothetical protein